METPLEGSLNQEVALHFRDQLREARAVALKDAQAFEQLIFVVERIGVHLTRKIVNLGAYADSVAALARKSPLVACRGESVTAVATPKGQKQVYAWRVPAIWTDLLPESHTNDLSATGH